MEGQEQAPRKYVLTSADVLVSLAKKKKSEILAMLSGVRDCTLNSLLKQLPVECLLRAEAFATAERKEKKGDAKKKKGEKERGADGSKKRKEREKFDFASFYARIKQSMLQVHGNGAGRVAQPHSLFRDESESLADALSKPGEALPPNEDVELHRVKSFVSQALVAEQGLNSLSFMQSCVIGKRFSEVFGYHQQNKASARFVHKQWVSYIDYLKVVAPGMDPRQERNYRRTFELAQLFPCVKLISGCSVHEFWLHMREFRDFLASNDHEAMQWRCAGDATQMQFKRTIRYDTFGSQDELQSMGIQDDVAPFAAMDIRGGHQEEAEFLEQKDAVLGTWAQEEEEAATAKRARSASSQDEDEDEEEEDIGSDMDDDE